MSADLDKAIDRAVREMLDVEPPADLRARVMAELPAAVSRLPAAGFRLPAFGWVLAAAAVIVLAVFVARRSEPLPQAPIVAKAAEDRYLAPEVTRETVEAPVAPEKRAAAVASNEQRAPRERGTGIVVAASLSADESGTTMEIAPLMTIASISVAPIAQDTIAPAGIAVRPLNAITEIQIAPLTPPDRR